MSSLFRLTVSKSKQPPRSSRPYLAEEGSGRGGGWFSSTRLCLFLAWQCVTRMADFVKEPLCLAGMGDGAGGWWESRNDREVRHAPNFGSALSWFLMQTGCFRKKVGFLLGPTIQEYAFYLFYIMLQTKQIAKHCLTNNSAKFFFYST